MINGNLREGRAKDKQTDNKQRSLFHGLRELVSQRYKKIFHIKYLPLTQTFAGEKIMEIIKTGNYTEKDRSLKLKFILQRIAF